MTPSAELAPIIDTHMHLDEAAFDTDRASVLAAARAAGVNRFINIGYKPERWESSRALRDANPDVDIVLGLHPQEADRFDRALDRALRSAIEHHRPIALGETGFDFSRSGPSRLKQERAFCAQLAIAEETGLPVIIHQRAAADALTAELDRWQDVAPIVLHSFDGDERLTDWAIERGCFVGIGGLACKSVSTDLRKQLQRVPVEQLLLETDAPYLTPPGVKDRRNTSANLPLIAETLAPLWDISAAELRRTTTITAQQVFRFDIGPNFKA